MQVVAVAEPRDAYREQFVAQHAIAPENVFTDWRQPPMPASWPTRC